MRKDNLNLIIYIIYTYYKFLYCITYIIIIIAKTISFPYINMIANTIDRYPLT